MISLRNFTNEDAEAFHQKQGMQISLDEIRCLLNGHKRNLQANTLKCLP